MFTISQRILVVCQHFWPENFRINDICEGFVEKGYEVDVLCGEPNYPSGQWAEGYGPFKRRFENYKGVNIYRTFEIRRGNNSNLRIFLNYITFPIASWFHIPRLLTHRYDKIFIYELSPVMMASAGLIIGKLKKAETIMYVLDLWPQNLYSVLPIKNKWMQKLLYNISMRYYKKADKLLTISEKMVEYFKETIHKSEDKICFVPQYCEKLYEENIFDQKLADRFKDTFNIVYTGNISPAQSFETIITVAVKIKKNHITDIRWIIVGDGMSRDWVVEEVEKNELKDYFVFEGYQQVADIPKYTYIADLLIGCLTESELQDFTIPAKVPSYMASGKPVLLAMNGEIQNIVKEWDCGRICDAGDSDQLYENCMELYRMSGKDRRNLGDNARNCHRKLFERNLNLDKIIDFMFV